MIRHVVPLALAMLLLATSAPSADSIIRTLSQRIDRALPSLVRVEQPADGGSRTCAGFVVDAAKGWAITARHCVTDGLEVFVDGEPSEVVKSDEQFTLLTYPAMTKPPLNIRTDVPDLGEEAVSIGFGYGILTAMPRHIAARADGDIGLDGPLVKGMSGGPVLDKDNRVIGLNQSTSEGMGVACGGEEIVRFLKSKGGTK